MDETAVGSIQEDVETSPGLLTIRVMTSKDIVTPGIALEWNLGNGTGQESNERMEELWACEWNRKKNTSTTKE